MNRENDTELKLDSNETNLDQSKLKLKFDQWDSIRDRFSFKMLRLSRLNFEDLPYLSTYLKTRSAITALDIAETHVSQEMVKYIFAQGAQFTSLTFYKNTLEPGITPVLLSHQSHLDQFRLLYCKISDLTVFNSSVPSLGFSDNIDEKGLESLLANRSVRQLHLDEHSLNKDIISKLLLHPTITSLKLTKYPNFTLDDVWLLSKNRNLKSLDLTGNPLGNQVLSYLLRHSRLIEIILCGCGIDFTIPNDALPINQTLKVLDLSHNQSLNDAWMGPLSIGCPNLTDINLTRTNITNITEFSKFPHLRSLKLNNCKSLKFPGSVDSLPERLKITELNLSRTPLGIQDILWLSKISLLKKLDVSGSVLGDAGAKALQNLLNLTDLNLKACNISDNAIYNLLKHLLQLKKLNVFNNPIRNIGIIALASHPLRQLAVEFREIENDFYKCLFFGNQTIDQLTTGTVFSGIADRLFKRNPKLRKEYNEAIKKNLRCCLPIKKLANLVHAYIPEPPYNFRLVYDNVEPATHYVLDQFCLQIEKNLPENQDIFSFIETKPSSETAEAVELICKITGISNFKSSLNGKATLTIHTQLIEPIQTILIDLQNSFKFLENLNVQCFSHPDNKNLTQVIIPDVKNHLFFLRKIASHLANTRNERFQKKLAIIHSCIKTYEKETIESFLLKYKQDFNLILDILFFKDKKNDESMQAQEVLVRFLHCSGNIAQIVSGESMIRIMTQTLDTETESLLMDLNSKIFSELLLMKKIYCSMNEYLTVPNYETYLYEILRYCALTSSLTSYNEEDEARANNLMLEYIEYIPNTSIKKREALIEIHTYRYRICNKTQDRKQQFFHYLEIMQEKNYFLTHKNSENINILLAQIIPCSLRMWDDLLNNSNLSSNKEKIFIKIEELIKFIQDFLAEKSNRHETNLLLEIALFLPKCHYDFQKKDSYNFLFSFILPQLQNLLDQRPKLEIKQNPITNKKYKKSNKKRTLPLSYGSTSKPLDTSPLPIPEKPFIPLLPPELPRAPTLHPPQDVQDMDKWAKTKKYRSAKKKEEDKGQQIAELQSSSKEKVYNVKSISKIFPTIYCVLRLPLSTSLAIIETAIYILNKGKLGPKNDQIKFVTPNERKKMNLPPTTRYKLKGVIRTDEVKGQLLRVYGTQGSPSDVVVFSIFVHKPHKRDRIHIKKNKHHHISPGC